MKNKPYLFTLFISFFLLCVNYTAAGQQITRGQVTDQRSKEPLIGVNVIYGKNLGVVTDADGNFELPCSAGMKLEISYIGYKTKQVTVNDCSTPVKIELALQSYSLQNVIVTGETGRVQIDEAQAVATLGTADLNQQTGMRLQDALNTVAGVQMGTRSPFGGQRLIIRGYYPSSGGKNMNFNGMGYQLLLNDIPLTSATGTTIMDAVDFYNLGRIDIIKGPSPFYGNEIAGAVNLYTERPQLNGTTFSQSVLAGNNGVFRSNSSVSIKNENSSVTVNYGRQADDGIRPNDASRKDYLSFLGDFTLSSKQQINTFFSYTYSDDQLAGMMKGEDVYARRAISNPNYVNNNGGATIKGIRLGFTSVHTFDQNFSNKSTVFITGGTLKKANAHGTGFVQDINYGARTNFMFQKQVDDFGIQGQLGAFFMTSTESDQSVFVPKSITSPFEDTDPQNPTDLVNTAMNYNFFTNWSVDLPADFKVTAGGLLNFNNYSIQDMLFNDKLYNNFYSKTKNYKPTFSPNVSVLKSFNRQFSVYAGISTGNSPALIGDILQGDGSLNENLRPEKAVQYEIGSKGSLLDNKLVYGLSLFNLKITDMIVRPVKDGVSYATNVGKQQNKGIELDVGYTLIQNDNAPVTYVKLSGSYTYSFFRYDDFMEYQKNSNVILDVFDGNQVAGIPPHRFNLNLDIKTGIGLYLNTDFKYKDRTPVTFDNALYTRPYNVLGAKIGIERYLGGGFILDAFAGADNITGNTYYTMMFVAANVPALGEGYLAPAPYTAAYYGMLSLTYNF